MSQAIKISSYHSMIVSTDIGVIGQYPQIVRDTKPVSWRLPPLSSMVRRDKFLTFQNYFDFVLNDNAKPTDLVDRASLSWGIVVSESFKQLLIEFSLPPHKFYPVKLLKDDFSENYYWFHSFVDVYKYIDFSLTYFEVISNQNFETLDKIPLTSEDFFRDQLNRLDFSKSIRLHNLCLTDSFPNYDIWENNIFGGEVLVSDRLVRAIKDQHLTGCEFQSFTRLFC